MTLRARLTAVFALLFGGLLIPFVIFLHVFFGAWLRSELQEQARHDMEQILIVFTEFDSLDKVTEELYRVESDEFEVQVRLLDNSGRQIFKSYGFDERPFTLSESAAQVSGAQTFLEGRLGDEPQLVVRQSLEFNGTPYICEVWKSQAEILGVLRYLLFILGIGVPVILLLSVAVGFLFARRALAPVEALRLKAEEIGSENLSARLPVSGSRDELHRLANTLNNLLARIESAFESMRRFTADASHELRIPLTNLRGIIEVNLTRKRTPEEHEEDLKDALGEVKRLTDLTADLLLLARVDARRLDINREPIDLSFLLKNTMDDARRLNPDDRVTLELGQTVAMTLKADESRLRQVLLILLENAIKYSPNGGRVTLSATATPADVRISVADTGEGIAPEHQEKVFERFYRVDKSRSREAGGTGLGLAIARSIVQGHGGHITLDSAPGRGSLFTIVLPRP